MIKTEEAQNSLAVGPNGRPVLRPMEMKSEKLKLKPKKSKPMPAVVVASDVAQEEIFPESGKIVIQGFELELKRNNFGVATFQGILEKYFHNNQDSISSMHMLYATAFAFTASARAKLRSQRFSDKEKDKRAKAHLLASADYEAFCDLVEDYESLALEVARVYGVSEPDEDSMGNE